MADLLPGALRPPRDADGWRSTTHSGRGRSSGSGTAGPRSLGSGLSAETGSRQGEPV